MKDCRNAAEQAACRLGTLHFIGSETMPFVFQQHSSYGSSTPAAARTMLQTGELVQAFPLTDQQRNDLIAVSHEVMMKLLACLERSERIIRQIVGGKAQIDRGHIDVQAGGRAVTLPAVTELRTDVEAYLYSGKLALREIARIFKPFYNMAFDHRYQRIRRWASERFGIEDRLYKLLNEDAAWIEHLIAMRNAVDHPGARDGTLVVMDFQLMSEGPPWDIREPVWFLEGRDPVPIASDLEALNHNLLTLFEDLLIDGLERSLPPDGPLIVYEIPEAARDPVKPIRYKVGLRPGFLPAPKEGS